MSGAVLYQLGELQFEVTPFSVNAVAAGRAADWAPKDVLGGMRPREFVGLGDEKIEFTGKLFPEAFPDNKNSMQVLDGMRRSGTPYLLMRGGSAGQNMGWYVIETVTEEASYLKGDGTGRVLEYTIALTRVPTPHAADVITTLMRLFA